MAGAVALAASLGASLGGCSGHPEGHLEGHTDGKDADGRPLHILRRGGGPEPDTLDPQRARSVEAQNILRDLCEGLTVLDHTAVPAPGIARAWSSSTDLRTWRFELRPEARWSNGDPVTAQDFVAALQRLLDPATGSPYAQVLEGLAGAREVLAGRAAPATLGVAAPDPHTLTLQLSAPAAWLPALLAHPATCPVHRPTLAAGNTAFRPQVMVSDGAFTLAEWVPGVHILLRRNPYYWRTAATRLDGVRYLLIADEHAELMRYRAGDLDVTYVVPRGEYDWIRAHLPGQLRISPRLDTYFYGFNLERAPFRDDARLRRALSLVIDRERLARDVLRVGEQPAWGWVPPGVADYTPQTFDYRERPLAARIDEARALYGAAGYSAAHPLRFELRYNAGEVHSRVAVAIAAMWKEALGAEAQLTAVEFRTLLADIDRGEVTVFRSSWLADYNDAWTFAQYFKSDFGVNLPHYRSARYDALLAAAAVATDAGERRRSLEAAERLMLADQPIVPIYHYVNKHLVSPRVHGWYDSVMDVTYSRELALE